MSSKNHALCHSRMLRLEFCELGTQYIFEMLTQAIFGVAYQEIKVPEVVGVLNIIEME